MMKIKSSQGRLLKRSLTRPAVATPGGSTGGCLLAALKVSRDSQRVECDWGSVLIMVVPLCKWMVVLGPVMV
jgi:hypothetical protein